MDSRTGPDPATRRPSLLATLRVLAVLVLVTGTAGSMLLARAWGEQQDRQVEERLDRMVVSRTVAIHNALWHYQDLLYATRALFLSSAKVTRAGFGAFAGNLDLPSRFPGLHGIGWIASVPGDQAGELVAAARADGAPSSRSSLPDGATRTTSTC